MGPIRAGIRYGIAAAVIALLANFHFLLLDPVGTPGWVIAVIEDFRTSLALASFLLLAILAALRTEPQRIDPDVSRRTLLFRDATLAATLVAVIAGVALIFVTFLQATVFADDMRSYAREAAPRILAYIDELGERFSDPTTPITAAEIEQDLAPPELRDVGQSISNLVLRALFLSVVGAVVGLLRGTFGSAGGSAKPDGDEAGEEEGSEDEVPGPDKPEGEDPGR
ncbi:MAG: hypothetical protein H0V53_06290 [Rubrobacter sp.]|nr:hypothetical protein [Rubrobacter sp.]